MTRSKATALNPREQKWLLIMGWLVGLALFVRFAQVLPCCIPPSAEAVLRSHHCDLSFAAACPSYNDCAPR
jgi:hypothetical protein